MAPTSPNRERQPRILVVGCGGIGGVLAIHLLRNGNNVFIATTNDEVRSCWTSTGPYLNGKLAEVISSPDAIFQDPRSANLEFDIVFVAVQATEVDAVAKDLTTCVSETARIVCLTNGLCEARLAEELGANRVVGAVVAWGARMPKPGHYRRTSAGGFLVGAFTGHFDPKLSEIIRLLETVGPVRRTENLRGARFSKLTINCAISTLGTIGGTTLGRLLVRRKVRVLGLSIMREAVEVAAAEGIRLEPIAKVRLERLVTKGARKKPLTAAAQHALLLAVGSRYRRLRSSMLAAIERGRVPAIDFINGEVVTLGRKQGIATPFNEAAAEVVWAISRGEMKPGDQALAYLARRAAELSLPQAEESSA